MTEKQAIKPAVRLLGYIHEDLWQDNRKLGALVLWHAILHLVGEPPRTSAAATACKHFDRVDARRGIYR